MTAVEVAGWQFHRQVHQAELFVYADLRPHARIACKRQRRLVVPRVRAELARPWNSVEDPGSPARADVVRAHVTFDVGLAFRREAHQVRRSDDDRVFCHDRCRVKPDLSGHSIDLLIVVPLQIDDAAGPEARDRDAGFRIECDQAVARRDVQDPLFAAVAPIRQASS
jgi:hypothetical protein